MSVIHGRTVLVTGGASGLGELLGRQFLARGAGALIIWDVDASESARIAADLRARGHQVHRVAVDVSDAVQVQDAVREMTTRGLAVDILVNNAGIVVGKAFVDHTREEMTRTIAVNTLGPMSLTRELLPGMIARGRGHVVNISSAAAMVSNPQMSVYCASKWALTGWSESLRLELERADTGVHVTTVMPYYIDTGMFAGVQSRVIPLLQPENVASAIVRAVEQDRIIVRMPRIMHLVPAVRGLLPARWFDRIAGDWFGIYSSMRHFRGRT